MRVAILGSTGFLGEQILETLEHLEDHTVVLLAAGENWKKLFHQLGKLKDSRGWLSKEDPCFRKTIPDPLQGRMLSGHRELKDFLLSNTVDGVFFATVGMEHLSTFWELMKAGKTVWMASKEILIALGDLFMREFPLIKRPQLVPLDSEHNAVWQMLRWIEISDIKRIFITASGGPFYEWLGNLDEITPEMALSHPNWKMGTKISVDSAHLINKGFEVLEASLLFHRPIDQIDVLVQRESLIHALVELRDGFLAAVLSRPDMRSVILSALQSGIRRENPFPGLDLNRLKTLHFDYPVSKRFAGYYLALEAGKRGGGYPAYFLGADEACVNAFMEKKIKFGEILRILENILDQDISSVQTIEDVLALHRDGFRMANTIIQQKSRSGGCRRLYE
ncbi:MAG TPA: hypothetical protein VLH40_04345 [Atribacteraceae bacterium]|nr:hypothetical protein [Atribacteraceae bacterium]